LGEDARRIDNQTGRLILTLAGETDVIGIATLPQ
jgi:hypothetical protein